ncbi:hypothetical protein P691DRAFT_805789 [Macrolepiota fuliginosa MF-IS2]|uniref:GPI ethanolamine phosphate transferase 1 n=1 Tax=Macrolepiota fuliginosa MF-IS2 TaxID=1400762 RepID=A0A9P5X768_9AGAR|nr:hypothetical protein P691DRAFT_805789 [Macrolepiota fuliginosa MF-IS2]
MQDALDGLPYLQTYDRTLLRTIVTLGYTGRMFYASLYVIRPFDKPTSAHAHGLFRAVPIITGGVLWVVFYVQNSPWSYYLYVSFSAYFWSQVLRHGLPHLATPFIRTRIWRGLKCNAVRIKMVLGALLRLSMGYTHRTVWSFGTLAMANSWLFQKNRGASTYRSAS